MKRFNILFVVLTITLSTQAQVDPYEKIHAQIIEDMESEGQATYLLFFKEQLVMPRRADLSKEAKGHLVYQSLMDHARTSQEEVINHLVSSDINHQSFFIANVIKVTSEMGELETLAAMTSIEKVIPDPNVKLEEPDKSEAISLREPTPEWGIQQIEADNVWSLGYRGQGVVVAGQDTGYDWDNPLLKPKYRGWDGTDADHNYNWHDAIMEIDPLHGDTLITPDTNPCGLNSPIPCDDNGHGTHTMGTMVGHDDNNAIGVAPDARWIACRNMERGYGKPSTYIECYEWLLAPYDLDGNNPDPSLAPHVINNSWSCPELEGCNSTNWDMMNIVINNLRAAGVVVVVSAGNSGNNGCGSVSTPSAMFEGSFTVGASTPIDSIAGFSSRGPVTVDGSFRLKPNVVAPGVAVRSTTLDTMFGSWNGTSMAGPHVAGAVALIISANPGLAGQVEAIETILETTAVPIEAVDTCGSFIGSDIPNATYGYGRINVLKAVEMALEISSTNEGGESDVLSVFPNPVSDYLRIRTKQNRTGTFRLISVDGKLIRSVDISVSGITKMDVRDIATGVYFLGVDDGEQARFIKVVKI